MKGLSRYKKLKLDAEAEPYLTYVYSLYDQAAKFFQDPMASPMEPEKHYLQCKRAALNGAFHYPNDLVLYLVGIFDSRNGRFVDCQAYEIGSLSIGDFARKVNQHGNVQNENPGS